MTFDEFVEKLVDAAKVRNNGNPVCLPDNTDLRQMHRDIGGGEISMEACVEAVMDETAYWDGTY